MEREKKWFYTALAVLGGVIGLLGLGNFIIDPYGLFRQDFTNQFIEPNKNFIKARFVTENPGRYDCYIFGSSRVNAIDGRHISGYHCYNMTYNGGLPHDHLLNLRYMLEKGVKVRLVLIGLDDFVIRDNPASHLSQPLRHPYPPVIGQSVLPFYLKYLFSFHDRDILEPIITGYREKIRNGKKNPIFYDMFATGQMFYPQVDKAIEANPEKHRNSEGFKKRGPGTGDNMKGVLEDMKSLVELAKAQGFSLVLFINPFYKTGYIDSGVEEMETFKRGLARLGGFWDFSGVNSVTSDTFNYYEASHYRPLVGNMILSRIVGGNKTHPPADFGVYVTSANIEDHLAGLRQRAIREFGDLTPYRDKSDSGGRADGKR